MGLIGTVILCIFVGINLFWLIKGIIYITKESKKDKADRKCPVISSYATVSDKYVLEGKHGDEYVTEFIIDETEEKFVFSQFEKDVLIDIRVNDEGLLTTQGSAFISFEKE